MTPPSELAPYRVPCGPRSTSTRAMSNVSKSPDDDRGVGQAGARAERHVVEVDADGRRDAVGVDAAQGDAGDSRPGGGDAQARHQRHEVLEVVGPLLFQQLAADDRDRGRNVRDGLRALLGGDDDLLAKGQGLRRIVRRGLRRRLLRPRSERRRFLGPGQAGHSRPSQDKDARSRRTHEPPPGVAGARGCVDTIKASGVAALSSRACARRCRAGRRLDGFPADGIRHRSIKCCK